MAALQEVQRHGDLGEGVQSHSRFSTVNVFFFKNRRLVLTFCVLDRSPHNRRLSQILSATSAVEAGRSVRSPGVVSPYGRCPCRERYSSHVHGRTLLHLQVISYLREIVPLEVWSPLSHTSWVHYEATCQTSFAHFVPASTRFKPNSSTSHSPWQLPQACWCLL